MFISSMGWVITQAQSSGSLALSVSGRNNNTPAKWAKVGPKEGGFANTGLTLHLLSLFHHTTQVLSQRSPHGQGGVIIPVFVPKPLSLLT